MQLQIQIGKAKIPRVLLGTSPFIGAGQFGSRAYLYYQKFYKKPEKIAKIILKAVDMGVTGIQALPYPPIFKAIKIAEENLKERLHVIATVGPENPVEDLKNFQNFNTIAAILHGEITDKKDKRKISELLNRIHYAGFLAGVTTHRPFSTISWLLKTELDMDLVMMPYNKLGMFMDAKPEKIAEKAALLHKPIIGKKVLAAGYLRPKEALEYACKSGLLSIVALGVASEKEAEETFKAAAEAFSGTIKV
ncbi:hypothetical protein J7K06_07295 [Candidatus Bathyarchaeota archaeon]|nr:hypothetical protein [Candidatus Bathyarchaeota archaeon]